MRFARRALTGPRATPAAVAVGLIAVLAVVGVLVSNAQQDLRAAAVKRFHERAEISAALTRSVFDSLGSISAGELVKQFGGPVAQVQRNLDVMIEGSNDSVPYLAVLDDEGEVVASVGDVPAELAGLKLPGGKTTLTDVQDAKAGPVVGYAVPLPIESGPRVYVQGLVLPTMREFVTGLLKQLPNPDGAELYVRDGRGNVLAHTTAKRANNVAAGDARVTAGAVIPSTRWKLELAAKRSDVLAGAERLPWLAWALLAGLAAAALAGVVLHQRLRSSSARERRAHGALAESRQQLASLVDALEEAVIAHHPDGSSERLNRAAENLSPERDTLDGLPAGYRRLGADGEPGTEDEHPVRLAFATGRPQRALVGVERPDGGRVWTEVRARPLTRPGEREPYLVVSTYTDFTRHHEETRQLADLADRDPLTGIWNRRRFDEEIAEQLARCRRHGETAGLLLLDVDGFKRVNDTLGHLHGDAVLQAIASRLESRLRATDHAARVGGDEFAALLVAIDPDDARRLGDELAADLDDAARAAAPGLEVSVSVGLATLDSTTVNADQAFEAADRAMYAAKQRHSHLST